MTVQRRVLLVLVLVVGCNGPLDRPAGVAVSGKAVLPSGAPLTGGTLILRPVGGIHGASAQIQPNGTFELAGPDGTKSVVPGKYLAYVRFNTPEQKALRAAVNRRYQDSEDGDSDVVVDIQGEQNGLVVQFKR